MAISIGKDNQPPPNPKATPHDVPFYFVLFRAGKPIEPYSLTISFEDYVATYLKGDGTLDYMLDRNFAPIMPALWLCLHLPRSGFDFASLGATGLKRGQALHLPHRVIPIPISVDLEIVASLNNDCPKIVFVPDELISEAAGILSCLSNVVRVTRVSEIEERQLQPHREVLRKGFEDVHKTLARPGRHPIQISRLIDDPNLKASLLPAQFVGRHLNFGLDDRVPSGFSSQEKVLEYALQCQKVLSLTAKLEAERTPPEVAEKIFPGKLAQEHSLFTCPVAVGILGLPKESFTQKLKPSLAREVQSARLTEDERLEDSALRFIVAHRALARAGVGLIAKPLDPEVFDQLSHIERGWIEAAANPRKVWRTLARIGKFVRESFERAGWEAMQHATSITAFCEFPIGLGIVEEGDDPLGFAVPIHYRPLIPLTNALQFELAPVRTKYIKKGFKLLVAECVPEDDPAGRLSRVGWESGLRILRDIPNIDYKLAEFSGPEALKAEMTSTAYDAIVISAHGGLDPETGRTGFACGRTFVVEQELGELPPIVCLSACQVSQRGTGSVNIGDLFLRRGAKVVIGPVVPIDAAHNAMLMARFFANLAATLEGGTDMRTLEDVWLHTTATNAMNDILWCNESLSAWALTHGGRSGQSVLEEFMMASSVNRLRRGHTYADTEQLLLEMARERGVEKEFRTWTSNGYLPESAMYVVMGWPDLFVLHDAGFDKIAASEPGMVA